MKTPWVLQSPAIGQGAVPANSIRLFCIPQVICRYLFVLCDLEMGELVLMQFHAAAQNRTFFFFFV